MVVKSFVFRENWFGSEVDVMQIDFFTIFDPHCAQIFDPKSPSTKFFKQCFSFQLISKTEAILVANMQL